jgi:hypothetical protein
MLLCLTITLCDKCGKPIPRPLFLLRSALTPDGRLRTEVLGPRTLTEEECSR